MHPCRLTATTVLLAAAALASLAADPPLPPATPGERDACPVCGMFVKPYPAWVAQIRRSDGSTLFFDGAKDLFRYLTRDEPSRDRVSAIYVTDYYRLEPILAERAFFVVGSDVLGPMGPELVAHGDRAAAEEFLADHRGTRIVTAGEIGPRLLAGLGAPGG